jgi:hypothetical protein
MIFVEEAVSEVILGRFLFWYKCVLDFDSWGAV